MVVEPPEGSHRVRVGPLTGRRVTREGVVNDRLGPFPLLVHVEEESRAIHVYFREAENRELTFEAAGDRLRDRETGSLWHPATGLALEGPLKGEFLEPVPYSSAFDWA